MTTLRFFIVYSIDKSNTSDVRQEFMLSEIYELNWWGCEVLIIGLVIVTCFSLIGWFVWRWRNRLISM